MLLLAVGLAGCAGGRPQGAADAFRLTPLPPGAALVLPPAGQGSVLAVVEQRQNGGLQQTVLLVSPAQRELGQNAIDVMVAPAGADAARAAAPSPAEIAREMARVMPMPMVISADTGHNLYGPFGFAVGGNAAAACFYGWQDLLVGGLASAGPADLSSVRLRVRLCARGGGVERLLAFMQGISVGAAPAPAAGFGGGPPRAMSARLPAPVTAMPATAMP
ncbi:cellulose biosynthesis protein BcsN, partial [Pseudoxanthobacter sp.]|uniref:cellulose biosynthesis protein BcsN n=1 Tax=Pseudoxanthobacter sp. TaxID=1925742 RepID=UPI002FE08B98